MSERRAPSVNLGCTQCDYRAKRQLVEEVACRGVYETPCEHASCPDGHGALVRDDGGSVKERAA